MATIANLKNRVGYNLGYTIGVSTPSTTLMIYQWLNDGQAYILDRLYERSCWHPLRALQKEAEYTLTGTEEYDVYTIIGSSTDYYEYINAQIGDYPVREVSIDEYHKIISGGEYSASATNPYLCFYEYDTATNHGSLPKVRILPDTLTGTLYFRYLKALTNMTGTSTPELPSYCDDALVFYAEALAWMAARQIPMHKITWEKFMHELENLIAKHEQPVYRDGWGNPVT